MFLPNPDRAGAETPLVVLLTKSATSDNYPVINAELSVVDRSSGRPVARLDAPSMVISDESGRLALLGLNAANSEKAPVAYSILLDTGGAMAPYLGKATELLKAVVAQLGPNDVVRIVKFNEGTDEQGTNWVRRDDPNLQAQIATWQTTEKVSLVVPALIHSSEVAQQAPPGFDRRASIVLLSVAGARGEPGLALDTIGRIPTTTFVFGFGQPPLDHENLPFFLEDLAKQRGGTYWPVDSPKYTGDGPQQISLAMHGVWSLSFRADGLPDGRQHEFTVEVRDDLQRGGSTTETYSAGSLLAVSPLSITGIKPAENVNDDRRITAQLGGDKKWADWQIELFRDCQPGSCSSVAQASNGALDWRLVTGPLAQGDHRLYFKVTVRDGTREFTDVQQLRFVRAGTGWNLWIPIGFVGIALIGCAVVVGAGRKRRRVA